MVGLVCQHLSMARIAEALAVSWNTANTAVLAEGRRVLINDPHRLDGVTVVGVDEHCWCQTRHGDKYVTVIIDLTPICAGTGPARLPDMVEGRSKQAFKTWLAARDPAWRDAVEVSGRRTLLTGADLLTDKQQTRLEALFATDEHVEVRPPGGSTSAW